MFRTLSALIVTITAITIPFASVRPAQAQDSGAPPISEYREINHPVMGSQGMVSTHNEIASEVGAEILRRGGNAMDAAAAIGFALAVTLPRAGNIGGGGLHAGASGQRKQNRGHRFSRDRSGKRL